MMSHLDKFSQIYAALVLAGAGILDWIDQTTMITLVIVLICCMPTGSGACRPCGKPER